MDDLQEILEEFKEILAIRRINQRQAGEEVGVSAVHISRILSGKYFPSEALYRRIRRFVQVNKLD